MTAGFGLFQQAYIGRKLLAPKDQFRVMWRWEFVIGLLGEFVLTSPESESALGLGFLLGLRRAMPAELSDNLKIAGLTHIVVASGYNLTILVRLARRLFAKRSKYLAMLSAAVMIIGFMAVTGFKPQYVEGWFGGGTEFGGVVLWSDNSSASPTSCVSGNHAIDKSAIWLG